MRTAGRLAAVALAAALGACAAVPPATPPTEPAATALERARALADFDAWTAAGRVAVRTPADGWSASFDWRERAGRGELGVRGPFGAGAARIVRTPELVTLDAGDGPPVEIPAPFGALDAVMIERLGFPLPVDKLRHWLLGVPAPDAPSAPLAQGFEQAGWSVRPEQLVPVDGAPAPLPRRLVLEREGARIRVAVDRWTAETP